MMLHLYMIKSNKKSNKMKTTATDQKVITLINRAFNADGYLVNKGSRKNKKEANEFLNGDVSYYGELVNGWDAHNCLLIIANPNVEL